MAYIYPKNCSIFAYYKIDNVLKNIGDFLLNTDIYSWEIISILVAVGNVTGAIIASQITVKKGSIVVNYVIAVAVCLMSFWLIYKQFI